MLQVGNWHRHLVTVRCERWPHILDAQGHHVLSAVLPDMQDVHPGETFATFNHGHVCSVQARFDGEAQTTRTSTNHKHLLACKSLLLINWPRHPITELAASPVKKARDSKVFR